MRSQSTQPVVAVDQVIGNALGFDKLADILNKFWQVRIDVIGIERRFRPGGDMDHAGILTESLVDMRDTRILTARIHIDLDTAPTQFSAQLPNINVHTARFFAAKYRQRAGMNTQHRDAATHKVNLLLVIRML